MTMKWKEKTLTIFSSTWNSSFRKMRNIFRLCALQDWHWNGPVRSDTIAFVLHLPPQLNSLQRFFHILTSVQNRVAGYVPNFSSVESWKRFSSPWRRDVGVASTNPAPFRGLKNPLNLLNTHRESGLFLVEVPCYWFSVLLLIETFNTFPNNKYFFLCTTRFVRITHVSCFKTISYGCCFSTPATIAEKFSLHNQWTLPNQQLLEGLDFRAYYSMSAKRPSNPVLNTYMLGELNSEAFSLTRRVNHYASTFLSWVYLRMI